MELAGNAPRPKRLNVLTLDGGGVRGLSTLLILQDLMSQINVSLRNLREAQDPHHDVEPHEIFDLVAGTSTGGLIAVMLGKLGMTLDECIAAYHDLSRTIFGKKHIRGRATFGLAPSLFSGSRLRRAVCSLLRSRGFADDLPMRYVPGRDKIACAVVCREHENESRYSDFKSDPAPICSLPCPDALVCLVCEAARATSAAPTYFPVQKIAGRSFVDGGMEFNNPSHAIFDHYSQVVRVAESRRTSVATQAGITVADHGNLDFTQVRIVNLGTGTKPSGPNGHKPGIFANLTPPAFRMAAFLRKTLTQMAVNSENTAKQMVTLARVSQNTGSCNVKYERFSANNGVCYIKLDRFNELETITTLTRRYLESPEIQQALQRVAEDIARDYLEAQIRIQPTSLTVPDRRPSRAQPPAMLQPQAPVLEATQRSQLNSNTQSGKSFSRDDSNISDSTTTTEASVEPVDTMHTSTPVIPARREPDITGPADSMIPPAEAADTVAPVRS